jgi:hypothetical protein
MEHAVKVAELECWESEVKRCHAEGQNPACGCLVFPGHHHAGSAVLPLDSVFSAQSNRYHLSFASLRTPSALPRTAQMMPDNSNSTLRAHDAPAPGLPSAWMSAAIAAGTDANLAAALEALEGYKKKDPSKGV